MSDIITFVRHNNPAHLPIGSQSVPCLSSRNEYPRPVNVLEQYFSLHSSTPATMSGNLIDIPEVRFNEEPQPVFDYHSLDGQSSAICIDNGMTASVLRPVATNPRPV